MLKVNQARNWDDFRAAVDGISVPGQMMTYADVEGHVRRTMAVRLPVRQPHHLRSFLLDSGSTDHWQRFVNGAELSADHDPQEGFVVSANESPGSSPVPVGLFFSPPDRARRLRAMIANHTLIELEGLNDALSDVYMATSHELSRLFSRALRTSGHETADQPPHELVALLTEWDGRYEADSRGALLFELVLHNFVENYYGDDAISTYWATWKPRSLVLEDLLCRPPAAIAASLRQALRQSARAFKRFGTWGAVHRLRLAHPFGYAPLFGGRYVLYDTAASGGSESVYKTGHRFGAGRHQVTYGSSARHISDLSDLDHNYFVLLGGQDGWLGSVTYSDHLPLWQRNKSIQVPLRPATARAQFAYRMELLP
jgi:penicillin amidase